MSETPSAPEKEQDQANHGNDWNSSSGRRRFLMSTGKAGALTILGLHGLKVEVLADTPSGSAS